MRLRYFCHYAALTGYGRAARDYLAALAAARPDIELEIVSLSGGNTGGRSPEPRYRHLDDRVIAGARDWRAELADHVNRDPDVAVVHAPPRALAGLPWPIFRPTRAVAVTTWETDRFPAEYAHPVRDRFDAVVVPSSFCRTIIETCDESEDECSTELDCTVVPHTFDPSFWPRPAPLGGERTRFYTIGAWGARKNALGVLAAYLAAFSKADNVSLLMLLQGADFTELRSLIARSGIPEGDLPEIRIPDCSEVNERELVELHAGGHCFVSSTRGEGWGLGLFEAAIMGRYIISPMWGGQEDFLARYPFKWEVPFHLTPCFGTEVRGALTMGADGRVQQSSTVAMPPGVTCRQSWADPDLSVMALAMRRFHRARVARGSWPIEEVPGIAVDTRADLDSRFGYNQVGNQLAALLEAIT